MKNYKGKAIYQPTGKAAEYAKWACSFYVGCSNGCTYCYLKKGRGAKILGGDKPTLKKCFKDEKHAIEVFNKELQANLPELQKHGLFFSFTTDPMLPETIGFTEYAIDMATDFRVPVKILTKRADWIDYLLPRLPINMHNMYAFGFTLTGHDEIEPGANTNQERIEAMWKLHKAGFKTFASIEPIIDFKSSFKMVQQTKGFCDLYKVGLESGKKYDIIDAQTFVERLSEIAEEPKIYLKESLQKLTRYAPGMLGENFVSKDYNIFNQQ